MSTPSLVTKSPGMFLRPIEPTPSGSLPLSSIDRDFHLGTFMESIFVFKHGNTNTTNVITKALRKALIPYHPLAGRLLRPDQQSKLELACTSDGIWFVEALANCTLEHVDWLEQPPLKIPRQDLFSYPLNPLGIPLFLQITQFRCGGFVIGLVADHTFADGIGISQFMVAVGEFARGELGAPSIKPIWCRETLPDPRPPKPFSEPPLATPPPLGLNKYFHIDISSDQIKNLKDEFLHRTGRLCSTFDIITSKIWQSRARAINLEPDANVVLAFSANIRNYLLGDGGKGYYGNCLYPIVIRLPRGMMIDASTAEVIDLIRDAKERLPISVTNWSKGDEDPSVDLQFGYGLLFMVDWTRLGLDDVDFGWGTPHYVAPMLECHPGEVACLVRSPAPEKSVRLITQCVVEENMAALQEQLMKAFDG